MPSVRYTSGAPSPSHQSGSGSTGTGRSRKRRACGAPRRVEQRRREREVRGAASPASAGRPSRARSGASASSATGMNFRSTAPSPMPTTATRHPGPLGGERPGELGASRTARGRAASPRRSRTRRRAPRRRRGRRTSSVTTRRFASSWSRSRARAKIGARASARRLGERPDVEALRADAAAAVDARVATSTSSPASRRAWANGISGPKWPALPRVVTRTRTPGTTPACRQVFPRADRLRPRALDPGARRARPGGARAAPAARRPRAAATPALGAERGEVAGGLAGVPLDRVQAEGAVGDVRGAEALAGGDQVLEPLRDSAQSGSWNGQQARSR